MTCSPLGRRCNGRTESNPLKLAAFERIKPFAQAMCLVVASSAVDDIEPQMERVHRVVNALSGGILSEDTSRAIMDDIERQLELEGMDGCIDDIAAELFRDPEDRWFAVELVSSLAFEGDASDMTRQRATFELAKRLGFSRDDVSLAFQPATEGVQSGASPRGTEPCTQMLCARTRSA